MILIEHRAPRTAPADAVLELPFDLRCKSRLRTQLTGGEEVGLFLERGSVLRDGDKLRAGDGRIVAVRAADEAVQVCRSADAVLLARAAYHLGNRHVPVEVRPGELRFPQDAVLADMVKGLGLMVELLAAPFEPESGAYEGGHRHAANPGSEWAPGRARIHDKFHERSTVDDRAD